MPDDLLGEGAGALGGYELGKADGDGFMGDAASAAAGAFIGKEGEDEFRKVEQKEGW